MSVRGVVLECGKKAVLVLTPGGRVRKVRVNYPVRVGEEIMLPPETGFRLPAWAAAAAVLLVILLGWLMAGLVGVRPLGPAVAYVSMDINPSLEFSVDENARVVDGVGLNEEGAAVLQGVRVRGKSIDAAAKAVIAQAVKMGYIYPGKENVVVFGITGGVPELEKKLESCLSEAVEGELRRGPVDAGKVQVKTVIVPGEVREKGRALGLSPGKYVILLEARRQGLAVTPEDLRGQGIVGALRKAGGKPEEVIKKASYEAGLKELEEQLLGEFGGGARNEQKTRSGVKGGLGLDGALTEPGGSTSKGAPNQSGQEEREKSAGPVPGLDAGQRSGDRGDEGHGEGSRNGGPDDKKPRLPGNLEEALPGKGRGPGSRGEAGAAPGLLSGSG